MKKIKMALTVFLAGLCMLVLAGCGEPETKEGTNAAAFTVITNEKGYEVTDLTANLQEEGLLTALKAQKKDSQSITLRFYDFQTEDQAKNYYDTLVKGYGTENPSKEKTTEGQNYTTYRAEFSQMNNEVILSRVNHSIVYIIGDMGDDISEDQLAKDLGV
ncbi:MAG: hypothetical protein VB030_09945 [Eubacterium aggregans]|uniref:DUF4358 domain-containing protein n=1 Tax=Eubacterium aggregans TaxID=81409 RepID=A0A1H4DXP4_9FIRM|nr:hypothetical protein [Eubacterium aggregans]MDD4692405.1 hypothetical protein [Eubacterium aggregans]MEA5074484.1 hypothetical protein [Eubacterium aggregans]SEA77553.1 hypothetical protein SAMN04515656_12918 [Eubacterium aggregans]